MNEIENMISQIEALREGLKNPDTIVVHPQHAARLTAAMVVTPEDEARIERAKAKRARRAAARRPSC